MDTLPTVQPDPTPALIEKFIEFGKANIKQRTFYFLITNDSSYISISNESHYSSGTVIWDNNQVLYEAFYERMDKSNDSYRYVIKRLHKLILTLKSSNNVPLARMTGVYVYDNDISAELDLVTNQLYFTFPAPTGIQCTLRRYTVQF